VTKKFRVEVKSAMLILHPGDLRLLDPTVGASADLRNAEIGLRGAVPYRTQICLPPRSFKDAAIGFSPPLLLAPRTTSGKTRGPIEHQFPQSQHRSPSHRTPAPASPARCACHGTR
jgi:hypothetical protein